MAICCGFAINQFREPPLPLVYTSKTERIQQAVDRIIKSSSEEAHSTETAMNSTQAAEFQTEPGLTDEPRAQTIDLAAFRAMQKHALILDTRPEIFHRFGHIPRALSLPRDDFDAYYNKQRAHLEKHKAHSVVLYCSGENCEDAGMVALGSAIARGIVIDCGCFGSEEPSVGAAWRALLRDIPVLAAALWLYFSIFHASANAFVGMSMRNASGT